MLKRKQILFYGLAIGLLAFLAVFSRNDLLISLALYDHDSLFGLFFAMFGEWPLHAAFLLAATYLFLTRPQENRLLNGIGCWVWGLSSILGAYCAGVVPALYFLQFKRAEIPPMLYLVILPVLILAVFIARKLMKKQALTWRKNAQTIVLYFYLAYLSAYAIKYPWGRLRFRDMRQPAREFTAWYLPQGFTGNQSFVSGHTLNACFGLLLVAVMMSTFPQLHAKGKYLELLAAIWIILVAWSRIVCGAHFASDVIMGAILGVTLFLALKKTGAGKSSIFAI